MANDTKEEKKDRAILIPLFLGVGGALAYLFLRRGAVEPPPPPPPDKATLWGTVKDALTDHGIDGIEVACNGYTGITEANGYYALESIEPGSYSVTFSDPLGRYEPLTV